MEPTTQPRTPEALSAVLSTQVTQVIAELSTWAQAEPRRLEEIEARTMAALRGLGTTLLEGMVGLATATPPVATLRCGCGQTARRVRCRPATVRTVLGPITVCRPYYHCPSCHHGTVPVDAALGLVAGSTSAGLDELLALLGAQQDSFAQAAAVLEKLTLVHVCSNLVRAATERLGQDLGAAEAARVAAAWDGATLPAMPAVSAPRRYVSLDGVLLPTDRGWKECKLGTVYATVSHPAPRHPEEVVLRAQDASFVALVDGPAPFGQRLWCEAARRGVLAATEVVALGDGAHWIWNLVAEQFPTARQIVDWYHAVAYLEPAGAAIYGEGTDRARAWVRQQRDALWAGQVAPVLAALAAHRRAGPAVEAAITYYTHNQHRMDYPAYRAAGLQIGSGPIESGCRHVIGMRLKGAGMHWSLAGVQAVATVRAWLKSGRWEEAMTLRTPRSRAYQRRAA